MKKGAKGGDKTQRELFLGLQTAQNRLNEQEKKMEAKRSEYIQKQNLHEQNKQKLLLEQKRKQADRRAQIEARERKAAQQQQAAQQELTGILKYSVLLSILFKNKWADWHQNQRRDWAKGQLYKWGILRRHPITVRPSVHLEILLKGSKLPITRGRVAVRKRVLFITSSFIALILLLNPEKAYHSRGNSSHEISILQPNNYPDDSDSDNEPPPMPMMPNNALIDPMLHLSGLSLQNSFEILSIVIFANFTKDDESQSSESDYSTPMRPQLGRLEAQVSWFY